MKKILISAITTLALATTIAVPAAAGTWNPYQGCWVLDRISQGNFGYAYDLYATCLPEIGVRHQFQPDAPISPQWGSWAWDDNYATS